MLKKFCALTLIFLFALPCASFAATYTYDNYDPFHLSSPKSSDIQTTLSPEYSTNNFGDIGFFYQVRDITGETYYDAKNVGGSQWFATVYENYSANYTDEQNQGGGGSQEVQRRKPYRRTLGGQIDDIPVSVIGDILDGFNFVFAEEPEPYNVYEPYYNENTYTLPINDNSGTGQPQGNLNNPIIYYDRYPDPLETLCIITADGTAKLNVNFYNPYARHFPFWWNWRDNTTNALWKNLYNWRNILATYTTEPVAYVYEKNSDPTDGLYDATIYSRPSVYSNFSEIYSIEVSYDLKISRDLATNQDIILGREKHRYLISDIATGTNLYITSGDLSSDSFLICSNDTVYYSVSTSDRKIYNSSGALAYTIEKAWGDNYDYICLPRTVKESILVQGLDDYEYQINVTPTAETDVYSAEHLPAVINIRGDSNTYGSKLAYITFRQRASFMSGYENFREASPIPLVFANVSKGNAADNPLIFDFIIKDTNDRVIKRMKFKWDAQENLPNQDLGTFFMMKDISSTVPKSYNIEARVTNRTGTRYMLYRYDRANPGNSPGGQRLYTLPSYWAFDLTEDTYGTLPKRFLLDSHSQIAPGLVTVYNEQLELDMTLDMTKDTTLDSFRLYEYNYGNPKDLWLNYKRVGNMYVFDEPISIRDNRFEVQTADDDDDDVFAEVQVFTMDFADEKNDEDNTENEIKTLTGKIPLLPNDGELKTLSEEGATGYIYINSSALSSFVIGRDLRTIPSFSEIYTKTETETETGDEETANTAPDSVIVISSYISSDKMAVVPMTIRIKVPRQSQLLKNVWEELDAAEDSQTLLRTFNKYGTVRVRSYSADELDADLFRAVAGKGYNLGVSAEDCVSAFIYKDYLYLDFIVFAADAVSKNTSKTAFVEIFKDDDVPYIMIGDGAVDGLIKLAFYVDTPLEPAASASVQNNSSASVAHSSGGGTCNINHSWIFIFVFIMFALIKVNRALKKQKIRR